MIDATYDPEADAVYFRIGQGRIDSTEETGSLICDLDAEGRILGIEVNGASRILAPGPWKTPGCPARRKPTLRSEFDGAPQGLTRKTTRFGLTWNSSATPTFLLCPADVRPSLETDQWRRTSIPARRQVRQRRRF